jgi:ribosomal protein L14
MPAVVIRQRKSWRRRDGLFLYFEVCIYPSSAKSVALTYRVG